MAYRSKYFSQYREAKAVLYQYTVLVHTGPTKTLASLKHLYLCACSMGGLPGDVSENPVTLEKQNKGWRMSCDVGEVMERLENEL